MISQCGAGGYCASLLLGMPSETRETSSYFGEWRRRAFAEQRSAFGQCLEDAPPMIGFVRFHGGFVQGDDLFH